MAEWKDRFQELTSLNHLEQAQWWLNGFWEEGGKEYAEEVWGYCHKFMAMEQGVDQIRYGKKMVEFEYGSDLDEMKSHHILEAMGETMTVMELRKHLKALDLDNNKKMAITEYLLDKYQKTPQQVVSAPQGDVDPVELAAAVAACDGAVTALSTASDEAEAASKALATSTEAAKIAAAAKSEADEKLASAQTAEADVKAAEAELQAAVDEITLLEKTKADKIAKCQSILDDDSAGGVKRGRAVQEKAALEAEDELPLRKAKITQTAALKRVSKLRKKAEEATAAADGAKKEADAAKVAADEAEAAAAAAKTAADAAKEAADKALAEAQAALDALKAKGGGSPQGKLWWMERTLEEKKKFMK